MVVRQIQLDPKVDISTKILRAVVAESNRDKVPRESSPEGGYHIEDVPKNDI